LGHGRPLCKIVGGIIRVNLHDSSMDNGQWTMDNGQRRSRPLSVHCPLSIVHCPLERHCPAEV
jgi:hypothetical protein